MPLFQRSPYYRTDILFGRFAGSPATAILSVLASVALTVALHHRPVLEFGYWWAAFAVFPGIWLLVSSLLYVMHLTFRLFGSDTTKEILGPKDLKSTIFRREALAFIVTMGLIQATIGWSLDGPVGQERFHNCVKGLREPGLRALAKTMRGSVSAQEFGTLCARAYRVDAAIVPLIPTSPEDLVKRYGN